MNWSDILKKNIVSITVSGMRVRIVCGNAAQSRDVFDVIKENVKSLGEPLKMRSSLTGKDMTFYFTSNTLAKSFKSKVEYAMVGDFVDVPITTATTSAGVSSAKKISAAPTSSILTDVKKITESQPTGAEKTLHTLEYLLYEHPNELVSADPAVEKPSEEKSPEEKPSEEKSSEEKPSEEKVDSKKTIIVVLVAVIILFLIFKYTKK